eukprot:c18516_g1_i1 orf=176-709(+)
MVDKQRAQSNLNRPYPCASQSLTACIKSKIQRKTVFFSPTYSRARTNSSSYRFWYRNPKPRKVTGTPPLTQSSSAIAHKQHGKRMKTLDSTPRNPTNTCNQKIRQETIDKTNPEQPKRLNPQGTPGFAQQKLQDQQISLSKAQLKCSSTPNRKTAAEMGDDKKKGHGNLQQEICFNG